MTAHLIDQPWADALQPTAGTEEERQDVVPVDEPAVEFNPFSTLGLVELLLKNPERADALNREEKRQELLIPRFLGIALTSYILFCIAMIVILNTAPAAAYPRQFLTIPAANWQNGTALSLLFAYTFGLVAATCICLPSFYFFSLLAGVRLSMLQVVGQVVRCKATSAIVLVGILPIYVAIVLGMVVFQASTEAMEICLYLGLLLPFIAGLEGVRSIYRGVMGMAETMSPERRCRRECFLRRLTLSWAAVYTAVSPVLIYRVWEYVAAQIA